MTDEQTVAAIARLIAKAETEGADATWTAHAIITRLRAAVWRPTQAGPTPSWQHRDVTPAPPTADYLAARPPSTTSPAASACGSAPPQPGGRSASSTPPA